MNTLSENSTALTLSIVHLDHSISQIDRPIADAVTHVLDQLSCSTPQEASEVLRSNTTSTKPKPCSTALREKVEKSILRYRRDQDRWTSLTSLLLKSLAYYRSLDPSPIIASPSTAKEVEDTLTQRIEKLGIAEKILPIVHLPRTKYNRPYLPNFEGEKSCTSPSNESDQEEAFVNENCKSMMNVSHQYPWVCMVQQHQQTSCPKDDSQSSHNLIGLDVVIFDARINTYTPTITEFLKSFVQSFTPWEWNRISDCKCHTSSWLPGRKKSTARPRSDESKLREFFLRWSMKEAYTKAMGLGMHINFDEFETRLHGIDLDADKESSSEQEDEGIWNSVMRTRGDDCNNPQSERRIGHHQLSTIGEVKRNKSATSSEFWEFIFIPLVDGGKENNESSYKACSCICRGPLAKSGIDSYSKKNHTSVESLTIMDLIQLHGNNP